VARELYCFTWGWGSGVLLILNNFKNWRLNVYLEKYTAHTNRLMPITLNRANPLWVYIEYSDSITVSPSVAEKRCQ